MCHVPINPSDAIANVDEALADAERALMARQESPADALSAANEVISRVGISDEARLVALWAVGLAERELNSLVDAETHLRTAIELGRTLDDTSRVAQVESALVAVLMARGRPEAALALADRIDGINDADGLGDLEMKRALALEQLGRLTEAHDAYTAALSVIERGHDRVLEARVRSNRAIVLTYQGDTKQALADLEIAERLASEHGQFLLAGGAAHNHGFTAGRRGDIVTALASFDRADRLYARVGYPGRCVGVLAADRCEVMILAGLHDEARTNAELAVRSLEDIGDVNDLAEALLLLARACLAQGDHVAAHAAALDVSERFRSAGREGWATVADHLAVRAATTAHPLHHEEMIADAADLARRLDALGWTTEAADVHVSTAELAVEAGLPDTARKHLQSAAGGRHRGSADRRANAWFATAMLRQSEGDRTGARRALGAGLNVLTRHQATLGATELRTASTVHARRLLESGLRMALDGGRPRDVLAWAERVRANALDIPSARSDVDDPLASALAELRRCRAELDDARRSFAPYDELEPRVSRQEALVRGLDRIRPAAPSRAERFSVERLQGQLGADRELVEYVEVDGTIAAVVVSERRCRLHALSGVADVTALLDDVVFSLGRMSRPTRSDGSLRAARAALDDALRELDDRLVRPLQLGDGEIVVVPTGSLHGVPWGGIDSLRRRSVVVTPSAGRWLPRSGPSKGASIAIVVGPGVPGGDREADLIASSYRSARRLAGAAATVAATTGLLETTEIAHIACHGRFRADSPMFSSLTLADGPLTVYDLERLVAPPAIVVLPACTAGRTSVSVGDELIGTASALLGIGVHSVIAPITILNDASTAEVMAQLHRYLSAGASPSAALAETRVDTLDGGDAASVAAVLQLLCIE